MSVLVATGLEKSYKKRQVVNSLSLRIESGEVVGLLGPNGAGKTTSFHMVVGLLAPDGGHIYLEGEEITRLPMYQRCRLGLGYLPQESSIFRKLTVEENVLAILEARGVPLSALGSCHLSACACSWPPPASSCGVGQAE